MAVPHWTLGEERGTYDHPEMIPPMPQPLHSNDLSARMARTETHNYYAQLDRRRIERESLQRSRDNRQRIQSIDTRVKKIEVQVGKLRMFHAEHLQVYLKWTVAVLLALAVLSGQVTLEHAKAFAPWLLLGG